MFLKVTWMTDRPICCLGYYMVPLALPCPWASYLQYFGKSFVKQNIQKRWCPSFRQILRKYLEICPWKNKTNHHHHSSSSSSSLKGLPAIWMTTGSVSRIQLRFPFPEKWPGNHAREFNDDELLVSLAFLSNDQLIHPLLYLIQLVPSVT